MGKKNKGNGNRNNRESDSYPYSNWKGKGRGQGRNYTPNVYQQMVDENHQRGLNEHGRGNSHGQQRDASSHQQLKDDHRGENRQGQQRDTNSSRQLMNDHGGENRHGQQREASSSQQLMNDRRGENQAQSGQDQEEDQLKGSLWHCGSCGKKFDDEAHQPNSLPCGHTFCKSCLPKLLKCLECQEFFIYSKMKDQVPVNYTLLKLINAKQAEIVDEASCSQGAGSVSCRPKFNVNKSVVTVSSNKQSKNSNSFEGVEKTSQYQQKSPHDSNCIERGKKPTNHCSTCQAWVCDECASIDHVRRGCFLRPKKEALQTMTKAQTDGANGSIESLKNHMTELDSYNENLDAFSFLMQAAFEAIKTEKERVTSMKKQAKDKIENLEVLTKSLSSFTNLPDALAGLQQVEDECGRSQHWMIQSISKILDGDQVAKISKGMLHSSVLMRMMAENEAKTKGCLFAQHTVNNVNLISHMTVEGGRVFVHSLKRENTVPVGSRAIPLTSVKTCLDKTSALTFLDVGWGEESKGRVLIRLLGDTQRGRQFVALCLGNLGTTLQNSSFHRIWSSGLPHQNIWGGDLKNGNGSGIEPVMKFSELEKKSLPHGRKLPIVAGLVAGSYETTNVSSIFRIYTSIIPAFSRDVEEEAYESSAFGKVECGLEVLHNAGNLNNIHDLKIYDCGIVIET